MNAPLKNYKLWKRLNDAHPQQSHNKLCMCGIHEPYSRDYTYMRQSLLFQLKPAITPGNFRSSGFTGAVILLFQLDVHQTGTDWCEISITLPPYKSKGARGHNKCVWRAHAQQCLCDGRACCPALPKQLVICRSWRFHRRPSPVLFPVVVSPDWQVLV